MAFGSPQFLYSSGDASIYPPDAVSGKSLAFDSYAFDSPTNTTGPTNSYGSVNHSTFLSQAFSGTDTTSKSNDQATYSFWIKKNQDTFAVTGKNRNQVIVTAVANYSFSPTTATLGVYTGSGGTGNHFNLLFDDKQRLEVLQVTTSGTTTTVNSYTSEMVFRDYSAWYHIVVSVDLNATLHANRLKVYVNGYQINMESAPASSVSTSGGTLVYEEFNNTQRLQRKTYAENSSFNNSFREMIGRNALPAVIETTPTAQDTTNVAFLMANLAEFHCIDGQALDASDFGKFVRNVWVPIKYTGTYGNTGYKLEFDDNFSDSGNNTNVRQLNSILDSSGNGYHFDSYHVYAKLYSPSNPTNTFCTLNTNGVRPNGGSRFLRHDNTYLRSKTTRVSTVSGFGAQGTMGASSGKWYWEISSDYSIADGRGASYGIAASGQTLFARTYANATSNGGGLIPGREQKYIASDGTGTLFYPNGNDNHRYRDRVLPYNSNGVGTSGTIFMIALDLDNGLISFGKNGMWYMPAKIDTDPTFGNSRTDAVYNTTHNYAIVPSRLANPAYASVILPDGYEKVLWLPFVSQYSAYSTYVQSNINFGQNPTFGGNKTPSTIYTDDNDFGEFYYRCPVGYKAWCTQNLPVGEGVDLAGYNSPTDYFDAKLYDTGNGTSIPASGMVGSYIPLGIKTGGSPYFLSKGLENSLTSIQNGWTGFGSGIGTQAIDSNGDIPFNSYYYPNRRDNETPDGENITLSSGRFARLDVSENVLQISNKNVGLGSDNQTRVLYQWNLSATSSPKVPQKALNYTGNGSSTQLITHGLGVEPDFMIFHNKDHGAASIIYNRFNGWGLWNTRPVDITPNMHDNLTTALDSSVNYLTSLRGFRTETGQDNGSWADYYNTDFLSTITENRFTVGHGATTAGSFNGSIRGFNGGTNRIGSGALESLNVNGNSYFVQLFANHEGYFTTGVYDSNSLDDGVFVYTGFRPAWILIKSVDNRAGLSLAPRNATDDVKEWHVYDQKIEDSPDHSFNHYASTSTGWTNSLTGRPSVGNPSSAFNEHSDLIFKEDDSVAGRQILIMSNGFMVMNKHAGVNGETDHYSHPYTYAAFADQPYKYANAF